MAAPCGKGESAKVLALVRNGELVAVHTQQREARPHADVSVWQGTGQACGGARSLASARGWGEEDEGPGHLAGPEREADPEN